MSIYNYAAADGTINVKVADYDEKTETDIKNILNGLGYAYDICEYKGDVEISIYDDAQYNSAKLYSALNKLSEKYDVREKTEELKETGIYFSDGSGSWRIAYRNGEWEQDDGVVYYPGDKPAYEELEVMFRKEMENLNKSAGSSAVKERLETLGCGAKMRKALGLCRLTGEEETEQAS